jgi:hypothetical protein
MKRFCLFLRQHRRIWWIGGSIVAVTLLALVAIAGWERAGKQATLSDDEIRDLTTYLEAEIRLEQEEVEKLEPWSVPLQAGPPGRVGGTGGGGSGIKVERVGELTAQLEATRALLAELRAREQRSRRAEGMPEVAARAAKKALSERKETLEALPKGNITLRAPTSMQVSDKRKVEAEVGLNAPKMDRPARPGTSTVEGTLYVSPEMIATLVGPGFEIKAITPEQQPIAEGFPTVWSWNVEAKESGEQELEATLYALVGDKPERYAIASYTQKISVNVREQSWGEWLDSLGHEILTLQGIFVALGAIATPVLAWFGLRRRGKSTAEST